MKEFCNYDKPETGGEVIDKHKPESVAQINQIEQIEPKGQKK